MQLVTSVREQFITPPFPRDINLRGKVIIVVGANRGLGFETALHLARLGPAKLILACRQLEKGNEAVELIKTSTACKGVEAWYLDLEIFQSIREFVQRFKSEGITRLDILVQCAAIVTMKYSTTPDGWEKGLQINYLSMALLSILLLPYMVVASSPKRPARLVIVGSDAHASINNITETDEPSMFEKLNEETYCKTKFGILIQRYPLTKLFSVFFVRQMTQRMGPLPPVTVVSCNPGFCETGILSEWKSNWLMNILVIVFTYLFSRTAEMGSRTIVHAAVSGSDEEIRGQYLSSCRVVKTSGYSRRPESRIPEERLWSETISILSKVDPSIPQIVEKFLAN